MAKNSSKVLTEMEKAQKYYQKLKKINQELAESLKELYQNKKELCRIRYNYFSKTKKKRQGLGKLK